MIAITSEIMIMMGSESKPPPQKSSYEQTTDRPNQKKTRILDTFIRNAWVSSSNWPFKTGFILNVALSLFKCGPQGV